MRLFFSTEQTSIANGSFSITQTLIVAIVGFLYE
jgi:hypothetical protein